MKKFLFVVATLATCMTASAQFWVGGSFNFSTNSVKDGDATTSWGISPEVGYALDDQIEVGLGCGIGGTKVGDAKTTNFQIAPFARYTFFSEGNFSIFGQAKVAFNYNKVGDDGTSNFGVAIQPGVKYAVSEKFSFVALLGQGLYFTSYSDGNTKSDFGVDFKDKLSLGIVYSF
ncbi:MAG: porin family protein [Bacteroidaceae bacterium]|nr:porin family protein [Bacteroidaceae bacterium]